MKITVIKINESSDWDESFLVKCGGRIDTIYAFNPNETTNCCEIMPSFCLYAIDYHPATMPENEEENEKLNTELQEVLNEADPIYVHCSNIKRIRGKGKRRTLSGFEDWDEALEYVKCNSVI